MNDDTRLRQELDRVSLRYRRVIRLAALATLWLALALVALALLALGRGWSYAVPIASAVGLALLALVIAPMLIAASRAVRNPLWIARRVEQRFPDLDARLLAALEQHPDNATHQLGFLQQIVIDESVAHAQRNGWGQLVSRRRMKLAGVGQWAALVALLVLGGWLMSDVARRPAAARWTLTGKVRPSEAFTIKIEPEDTSIERNTGLLVLARFGTNKLPADVQLLVKHADGQEQTLPMSKSLEDPVFAGRVGSVAKDLTYAVRYGDEQTRWFKVGVFDYPELKQADADLKFPEYTGMGQTKVEDTRSVTAVEGTKATLTFKLNKPVKEARLDPKGAADPAKAPPIDLKPDPADPSVYTATLDMRQSQKYQLHLVDDQKRTSKEPAELAINVTPNRPPDLKLEFPGHDVDVSPLQEMTVKAKVWDDFGVRRVGLTYAMAGQPPKDVVLAEKVPGKERKDVSQMIPLEQLHAAPDQLLSYHLWVEDFGPDGQVRRTSGDMFFAEVRPFDEIFRQGQQPTREQQQQQQQQGNAQEAEKLAELQKQVINATWKVIRRETAPKLTDKYVPDVKLIGESQSSAKEKAEALEEKLKDERSLGFLKSAMKHMDDAVRQLEKAAGGPATEPLGSALSAEQAAYQDLLKLRAREHEVVRGQQSQRGQQSSASQRRQQQLNQLELKDEENRYETQRSAQAQQQQDTPEQRETRQVLSRLKELAQRQEDLNRQMKELQSALEKAQDQAKKEELQRQLARLRDQQQQMLRDTDELRDRMEQPENQERMAEARQQLDQTRQNVRKAEESLEQGKVPEANAAGARASEQFQNLRDQVRKQAAGQFNDALTQMRQDARELDKNQKELSQKLADADQKA
jgi:hypothetical protein